MHKSYFFLIFVVYLTVYLYRPLMTGYWHESVDVIFNSAFLFSVSLIFIRRMKLTNWIDFLWGILFIIYLIVLHHFVTYINFSYYLYIDSLPSFNSNFHSVNLQPFETIERTFSLDSIPPVMLRQIFGNLFLLMPFGFLVLRLKIVKGAWNGVLWSLYVTVGIELFQFLLSSLKLASRSTDIDDVILNTTGGMIGVTVYWILEKIKTKY